MKPTMRFLRDSRGVTVIGYAQIATVISILAIFGIAAVSGNLYDLLTDLTQISSAALQVFKEI
ncbi:MAG: Flp family type IVb pilin [Alphaproteobacteria bacterium]|nr:Flp family type IVb pilin [Alphaproteobacteria bacterium]